jgi:DNA polymerase-4
MKTSERAVAHVDMDAFYASVEQRDDRTLCGRPVIVGGTGRRGVVAAASYEARAFGVHSAQPMQRARQCCPRGVFIAPRMARYRAVSERIFRCFREFTPRIEGLSLDEAFLDLTGTAGSANGLPRLGEAIKERIRTATGLTASVGLGPNKFIAKLASEHGKPDGLHHVPSAQVREFLDPLPVAAVWGIGPKTCRRLMAADLTTLYELRTAPAPLLRALLGRGAESYRALAAGDDPRPVAAGPARSVSAERTFETNISDTVALDKILLELTETVAARLRLAALKASAVTVKLREADFTTHTRQRRFSPPGDNAKVLYRLARALLNTWATAHPGAGLRLLGVGASQFTAAAQLDLLASLSES